MWTLRVTDDYITNWKAGNPSCWCPLSQALEQALRSKDTPVISTYNASPETGVIVYQVQGGYYYKLSPNPPDKAAAIKFISQVDNLELGQRYPRKRIFHYSNPEPYYYPKRS